MKVKAGFRLRHVCGEHIVVAEGLDNIDFSRIISLNDAAVYLWDKIADKDFTAEQMVEWLTEAYEIDEDTAQNDVDELVAQMLQAGLIVS